VDISFLTSSKIQGQLFAFHGALFVSVIGFNRTPNFRQGRATVVDYLPFAKCIMGVTAILQQRVIVFILVTVIIEMFR